MDVSVIIPARNEEFLQRTIDSVLSASKADTEVIAVLDGYWPTPGVEDNERVRLIHLSESIGQRAAINMGVRLSNAKYVMKLDAHCILDDGFDVKLMADMEEDWVVLPRMYNLDVFHWKCLECGREENQGPKPEKCQQCGKTKFERKIVWKPRKHHNDYMWFDTNLRMAYFDGNYLKPYGDDINELKLKYSHKTRDWAQYEITDVMNGLGACWFLSRDWYWHIGGCDEAHGSWGQQAVEMACKAWLSGGRHVVNKKTWFAHLFRTQGGFSWPYPMHNSDVEKARAYSRDLWLNDKWPMAKRKFSWLIEKFSPLPGWDVSNSRQTTAKQPTSGIIYYTDNQCEERVALAARQQIKNSVNGMPIVSVSLYPLMDFGKNIVYRGERGHITYFRQILTALEHLNTDIVYFCEHDVLYNPTHFMLKPADEYIYYYNENTWKVCAKTGQALFYYTKQVSGLFGYRKLLLDHYRKRIERIEREGFSRGMGYEPGTHRPPNGIDGYRAEGVFSEIPLIDIRHNSNLTANRFSRDKFRSQRSCEGWTMASEVPGWGRTKGRFNEFLLGLNDVY